MGSFFVGGMPVTPDRGMRKQTVFPVLIGFAALLFSYAERYRPIFPLPFDIAWLAVILCGAQYFLRAATVRAAALSLLSLSGALLISLRDPFAGGCISMVLFLGALAAERILFRSGSGIAAFLRRVPKMARVIDGEKTSFIPMEGIRSGDTVRVLCDELIPVDGYALSSGKQVRSGVVNRYGTFDMSAAGDVFNSDLQRAVRLLKSIDVENDEAVKKTAHLADWTALLVFAAFVFTWVRTGSTQRSAAVLLSLGVQPMILSAAASLNAAVGNAAGQGYILFRTGILSRKRIPGSRSVRMDAVSRLDQSDLPEVVCLEGSEPDPLRLSSLMRDTASKLTVSRVMCCTVTATAAALSAAGLITALAAALTVTAVSTLVLLRSAVPSAKVRCTPASARGRSVRGAIRGAEG